MMGTAPAELVDANRLPCLLGSEHKSVSLQGQDAMFMGAVSHS